MTIPADALMIVRRGLPTTSPMWWVVGIWLLVLLASLGYWAMLRLRTKEKLSYRRSDPVVIPFELDALDAADASPLSASHISLGSPGEAGRRKRPKVRLVIISDTHGFESMLTDGRELPPGDVLIHCGDFAVTPRFDGMTVEQGQRRFDAWLARQPHAHKIVIAGNHDPPSAEFPRSGAIYAGSGPRSIEVAGVTLALVPWFREKSRRTRYVNGSQHTHVDKVKHKHFCLPRGEVLISHSPPHRIVDRCGSGECAGSVYLRTLVQKAAEKPALWLCGHIHEDRGGARVRFGGVDDERVTVVVNAANANHGIARRCVRGPIVIDA